MTYLATEMLLYLLSASAIGLFLGWLFGLGGRRRKLDALRQQMMGQVKLEKAAHRDTKTALETADARMNKAVVATKTEAREALGKLERVIDEERAATAEVQRALEKLRAEQDAVEEKRQEAMHQAIDQAMRAANAAKDTAAKAMANEAQSRAEIEELRLLVGAEKLAAENARMDLTQLRSSMETEIEIERANHLQAKRALDDISATLSRSLGVTVGAAALNGAADPTEAVAADVSADDGDAQDGSDDDRTADLFQRVAAGMVPPVLEEEVEAPVLDDEDEIAVASSGDVAEAEEAAEVEEVVASATDEAPEELTEGESQKNAKENAGEAAADLSPSSEAASASTIEVIGKPDGSNSDALVPVALSPGEPGRPVFLAEKRPEDVDNLQAIDGITPGIEWRLNENGCYHYDQLAKMTVEHIAWLARSAGVTAYQITADRWIDQAKVLAAGGDPAAVLDEDEGRENAAG